MRLSSSKKNTKKTDRIIYLRDCDFNKETSTYTVKVENQVDKADRITLIDDGFTIPFDGEIIIVP